ncbi:MAG: hypothetical protein AAF702_08215 [Chloroflexota bacterium]
MHSVIDIQRLTKLVLLLLVLPVGIGGLADYLLNTTPFILIATSIFFIPLASFLITRTTLTELDRVIESLDRSAGDFSAAEE